LHIRFFYPPPPQNNVRVSLSGRFSATTTMTTTSRAKNSEAPEYRYWYARAWERIVRAKHRDREIFDECVSLPCRSTSDVLLLRDRRRHTESAYIHYTRIVQRSRPNDTVIVCVCARATKSSAVSPFDASAGAARRRRRRSVTIIIVFFFLVFPFLFIRPSLII